GAPQLSAGEVRAVRGGSGVGAGVFAAAMGDSEPSAGDFRATMGDSGPGAGDFDRSVRDIESAPPRLSIPKLTTASIQFSTTVSPKSTFPFKKMLLINSD